MGFIEEIMDLANYIKSIKYSNNSKSIFSNLIYKHQMKKLKNIINGIKEDKISVQMIYDYAEYFLKIYGNNSIPNHIKHITKGKEHYVGSISFEFDMPENYIAIATFVFENKQINLCESHYSITGPNSQGYDNINRSYVEMIEKPNIDITDIGKSKTERILQLENIFVTTFVRDLKSLLLSYLDVKEIKNE